MKQNYKKSVENNANRGNIMQHGMTKKMYEVKNSERRGRGTRRCIWEEKIRNYLRKRDI